MPTRAHINDPPHYAGELPNAYEVDTPCRGSVSFDLLGVQHGLGAKALTRKIHRWDTSPCYSAIWRGGRPDGHRLFSTDVLCCIPQYTLTSIASVRVGSLRWTDLLPASTCKPLAFPSPCSALLVVLFLNCRNSPSSLVFKVMPISRYRIMPSYKEFVIVRIDRLHLAF